MNDNLNKDSMQTKRKPLPLSEEARKAKNESARRYRERHKEQIAEYAKKYRAEHLEELRAYSREYQRTHREQIRAKQVEYWERKGKEQMSMADALNQTIEDSKDLPENVQEGIRKATVAMFDELMTDKAENPVLEEGTRIGKNGMIIHTVLNKKE